MQSVRKEWRRFKSDVKNGAPKSMKFNISNFAFMRLRNIVALCAVLLGFARVSAQDNATPSNIFRPDGGQPHKHVQLAPSYAWKLIPPLGLHEDTTLDTLMLNYYRESIPSLVSDAWTTTGNLGGEGINEIWTERPAVSDFFFRDALLPWVITEDKMKFYNTRIPMTLLSFNTGGSKETTQDRLRAIFSGNINRRAQIGANLDYLYSKGSYANQADKDLTWGFNGSYMGDRYEVQAFYNHYNLLNKENGGITDDLYITDPAKLQGGVSSIDSKSIPTNLSNAHTRFVGGQLYVNNRYKVGYWHHEQVNDTTVNSTYIPVSSFIWTLDYTFGRHMFLDTSSGEIQNFFDNTYLSPYRTEDRNRYYSLRNTFGISMLEGFQKWAKFGLAAYATHELQRYTTQTADTLNRAELELTPFPDGITSIPASKTINLLRVGGQLTKQQGSVLTYQAGVEFGLIGPAAGDINAYGRLNTRIPLPFDTLTVHAYGEFDNRHAPYLLTNYLSNHFIWQQELPKTQRYKFGGSISIPRTWTKLSAGFENVTNLLYWNEFNIPTAADKNVQVLSVALEQGLHLGIFNWENRITFQQSSRQQILPLPALTVYSNMYLLFRIATLKVQFGVDCDYYTRFYAPLYQPATMSFHVQDIKKVGNYPFTNVYLNMKLGKARFYVMFTHVTQGLFNKEYFSMPGYPLNPRRFQMGVSVDFAN